jgi:DNA repair exonuclease SbcCD ATPase subunit
MQEIEVKFQELVAVSPEPPAIDVTGLYAVAEKAKALVDIDIDDVEQMTQVTSVRKELAEARKATVDFTEAARERSYSIYKGVLEVKNTLLEIITPEEDRLKGFEKALKEQQIRESRLVGLPEKKEKLQKLSKDFGGFEIPDDDAILDMDDATFILWFNEQQGIKNEQIANKLAEQQAKLDAEKAEADRIEKAREEERRLAEERLANEKAEAKRREEEADAEIARLKAEAEAKEQARLQAIEDEKAEEKRREEEAKAEEKRLSKLKALNTYRSSIEFDMEERVGDSIVFYKKVGEFKVE